MKVLYFHQYFTTLSGSGGTRSYWMARALSDAGHSVHMICGGSEKSSIGLDSPFINGKRSGIVDGFLVTQFDIAYSNHMGFIQRSLVFLKFAVRSIFVALRENCDLVFCTSTPLTAGVPGIFARWIRRKKFIFEVRDLWPEIPREMGVIKNPIVLKGMSFLEWMTYRSAHACIGLSPGIVEGIKRRSPVNHPVTLIPNGCDLGEFRKKETRDAIVDGIENDDFVAIFTGAHGMANGLDAVLDTAAVLLRQGRNSIKFLFIGDGMLKPALQKRKEDENLTNCLFLQKIPKNRLDTYMRRADVGLMILKNVPAFYYGTSPNKFFDYITAGLPVLNNYPGWLADMITEYNLGLAVAPDSPDEFANALIQLCENPADLELMGKNSRKLAEGQFNRQFQANKFVKFLQFHSGT